MREIHPIMRTSWIASILFIIALAGLPAGGLTAGQDLALAQTAQDALRWRDALAWDTRAAQLAPDDPRPWAAIAQIRLWQGMLPQAQAAIQQALARDAHVASSWDLAGRIAIVGNDAATARADWRRALTRDPAGQMAASALVTADLRQGDAMAAWRDATMASHPSGAVIALAAIAALHLGYIASAREMVALATPDPRTLPFTQLAVAWHGSPGDLARLGDLDLVSGWPALALGPLHVASAALPASGATIALLGWAEAETGAIAAATAASLQAMHLAPALPLVAGLAAWLVALGGDPTRALRMALDVLATHPDDTATLALVAAFAARANQPATEFLARWQLAMLAAPADRVSTVLALAALALRTGLPDDPIQAAWLWRQMQSLAASDATAADLAATRAWRQRDPVQALDDARVAVRLSPQDATFHAHLAKLLATLGQCGAASAQAGIAAELDPLHQSGSAGRCTISAIP